MRTLLSSAVGVVMLAGTASAVDGVLEINQACAVNTGCFTGDAAGFPVTISQAGSYRLTGNLTTTEPNDHAITIPASDVTLDLNGFAIIGPAAGGTGNGVIAAANDNVSVINGTVRGMGGNGIFFLSERSHVEKVNASSNGNRGILVSGTTTVAHSVAEDNGLDGILTGAGCTVIFNAARNNGADGIDAAISTVSGNIAIENSLDGIKVTVSTVSGNTAAGNGGDGIDASLGSTVIGNTLSSNDGFGLRASTSGYTNNVITNNTLGTVSVGVEIGTNLCDGSTTCP